MTDPILEVADDLVAQLAAAVAANLFTLPFTVERIYTIEEKLVTKSLGAVVMPLDLTEDEVSRAHDRDNYTLGIALTAKVPDSTTATVDPLINLLGEIRRWLRKRDLGNGITRPGSRQSKPLYDHAALKQRHEFIGFIQLDVVQTRKAA